MINLHQTLPSGIMLLESVSWDVQCIYYSYQGSYCSNLFDALSMSLNSLASLSKLVRPGTSPM